MALGIFSGLSGCSFSSHFAGLPRSFQSLEVLGFVSTPSSSPPVYLLGDPLLFCGFKHLLYEASATLSPQLEPLFWAPDTCLQLSAEQPHSDVWKISNS